MLKREVFTGKTVEDAVQTAAAAAGVTVGELTYTVLDETRKGFLGLSSEATIEAEYELSPDQGAKEFLTKVFYDMGLNEVKIDSVMDAEGNVEIAVNGEHLGAVIGRHGEVMDSLQYLTSLVVNRGKGDYIRVTLDVEGYRAKRAEALEQLAVRMAERVARTSRAVTLEPMNPYERRIIHSKVQEIEGVITFSVGEGDERKIVVAPEGTQPTDSIDADPVHTGTHPRRRRDDHRDRGNHRDGARKERSERRAPVSAPRKSTVDYAAIAASLPPRETRETVKAKSIDELPLADIEDTVDVVVDDKTN